jgi:RNA recognition motif-containing protein
MESNQHPSSTEHTENSETSGPKSIFVSNLSPLTNETTLAGFFSFCGKIEDIQLTTYSGQSAEAVVTFESPAAAKTALLLSNAMINDRAINVTIYVPGQERTSGGESSSIHGDAVPNKPHLAAAEDRSSTSVMASLLAAGYVLGQDAVQKAKEIDEKNQFTAKATAVANKAKEKLIEFDEQYGVSNSVTAMTSGVQTKAREIDDQYKISDGFSNIVKNVSDTIEMSLDALQRKSREIQESPKVKSTVDSFWDFVAPATESVKHQYNEIKEQTKREINDLTGDFPPEQQQHPNQQHGQEQSPVIPPGQEELINFDAPVDNNNQQQQQQQQQQHQQNEPSVDNNNNQAVHLN